MPSIKFPQTAKERLAWAKQAIRQPFDEKPTRAVLMQDGEFLCSKCAKDNWNLIVNATRSGLRNCWAVAGSDPIETKVECCHCNAIISP